MENSTKNLISLLSEGQPKKISAIFKMKLAEIYTAKQNGFTNNQIIEALNNEGIRISKSTFKNYLVRYRHHIQVKKEQNDAGQLKKSPQTSQISNNEKPILSETKKNLDDIKKIRSSSVNLETLSKMFKEIK